MPFMDLDQFIASLKSGKTPPEGCSLPLQALWWSENGNWEAAHGLSQDAKNSDGDWVHGYLHRVEGDEGNAGYWYSRSGKPFPEVSLEDEWRAMVVALLG